METSTKSQEAPNPLIQVGPFKVPKQVFVWSIIILLSLVWGSAFIIIKRILEVFNPLQIVSGRILFATIALTPYWISFFKKAYSREQWIFLLLFGLTGHLIPLYLLPLAQTKIDSGLNGMLTALSPLMTLLVGVLVYRDRMKTMQTLGLLLGFLATMFLLAVDGNGSFGMFHVFGLFSVLATVSNGFNANLVKFHLSKISPLQITALSFLLISPIAFGIAAYSDFWTVATSTNEGLQASALLFALAIFSNSIGVILYARLIQISSPVFASLITYLLPVVAMGWGIWDGEALGWVQAIAMLVIIGSVYIANLKAKAS